MCSVFVSVFFILDLVYTHPRRPRGSQSRREETRIGTGVKFSSKARRAPGNIPLMDEFQSDLNSDYLIGRKFPPLSFFRPIREPHTMKSDHDSYRRRNATSTVAIFFYRSPCLARKTNIPCGENLGRKGTHKIQNSTNST